eukprot:351991-Chlamydomonas_euryale.AAC.1
MGGEGVVTTCHCPTSGMRRTAERAPQRTSCTSYEAGRATTVVEWAHVYSTQNMFQRTKGAFGRAHMSCPRKHMGAETHQQVGRGERGGGDGRASLQGWL